MDSTSDSFVTTSPDDSSFATTSYGSNDATSSSYGSNDSTSKGIEGKTNPEMLKEIEALMESKINPITVMLEKLIKDNKSQIDESKKAIEKAISDGLDGKLDMIEKQIQEEKDRNDEAVTEILDRLRSLEDIFGPPDEFGPDEFGPPRPTGRRGGGESLQKGGSSAQSGANVEERIEKLAFNLGITLDPNQPAADQVSNIEFIVCGKQMSGLITARVSSLEEEIGI
jgi:hypothetical protein